MISIIIPTLNEESVIEKTLTALKSGLKIPHEIIVTDGKSTDKTVEISRGIADKVVAFTDTRRQTIAEGRNDGARAASGEFLAFMDADCSFTDPNAFFESALRHFARDPMMVALTVAIRVLPEYETLADKIVYICFNKYLQILNNIFKIGISAGEFQMMRKRDFDAIGGYNQNLVASEDVDLFNRISKLGNIVFDHSLTIYQTGRRGHKVGWPKLLSIWIGNTISMMFRGKAISKEWKVIR